MKTNRPPKWHKWKHMPHAELWECVALSLNIEPGQVKHSSHSWVVEMHLFEESEEFKDRLDIAERNLSMFNIAIMGSTPRDCSVPIANFSAWAISIGWEIPDEFAALAGGNTVQSEDLSSSSTSTPEILINSSQYWLQLKALAEKSIQMFPAWAENQKKIQKAGNLHEWLCDIIGADNREAEILKKILSDLFPEFK